METALIVELLRAVWREFIHWRSWVFALFIVLTFAILAVGIKWPERYETSVMIHVDTTNIIIDQIEIL